MTNDEKHQLLQAKLAEMARLAQSVCELGIELGLDCVPFLGSQIRFAVDGEPAHDRSPLITKSEWTSSNFGCYPGDEEWKWFHGPNPPPKPYDYDY